MASDLNRLRAIGVGLAAVPIVGWVGLFSLPKPDTPLLKSAYLATLATGLGCSIGAYAVARRLHPLERANGAVSRVNEDIWVHGLAVNADRQMRAFEGPKLGDAPPGFPPLDLLTLPSLPDAPMGESIPTYALSSLPSESKHLLLCGDTGAGKSTLVKAVVAMFPQARVRVYDIDATADDWQGYEVIGRGDDFPAIARAMTEDLAAFDDRAGLNTNAATDIIIAEEYPALAEEIPTAKDWLKKLARRGRKRGFRVVLVSQDIQVDSLGLRNQSKVLTNFNKLFLGGYAFDKLQDVKDRQERGGIHAQLQQQTRPCLAEVGGRFFPCELPNLAGFRVETANVQRTPMNPPRTQPANPLEPLLSLGSGGSEPREPDQTFNALNPEISPDERGFVVSLKRSGLTQDPIIKKVWGCSKGGSANYLAARDKYRQIIGDAGLM